MPFCSLSSTLSISPQTLFEDWLLTLYSIIFTFLPVLAYGCFNKDIEPAILLRKPRLYRANSGNADLGVRSFFWYFFVGVSGQLKSVLELK